MGQKDYQEVLPSIYFPNEIGPLGIIDPMPLMMVANCWTGDMVCVAFVVEVPLD
jgi:hypothetical protein